MSTNHLEDSVSRFLIEYGVVGFIDSIFNENETKRL